jgi:hypothetical protein
LLLSFKKEDPSFSEEKVTAQVVGMAHRRYPSPSDRHRGEIPDQKNSTRRHQDTKHSPRNKAFTKKQSIHQETKHSPRNKGMIQAGRFIIKKSFASFLQKRTFFFLKERSKELFPRYAAWRPRASDRE